MEMEKRRASQNEKGIFAASAALLIFAPIFRASNLPLPLMLLEMLALGLLLLMLLDPQGLAKSKRSHLLFAGILLAIPAFFLIPVPGNLWALLPGRADYLLVLNHATAGDETFWKSLSLIGIETEAALWALLPALVIFTATINQPKENIRRLVYIVIGIAVFQAALGLMQYGAGPQSPLYFGSPYASKSAAGTYYNRDHFAGFLEMIFPVVLALIAATVGQNTHGRGRRWRHRFEFLSSVRGHQVAIYCAIGILLILALIFTRSRAGVALTMLGLFLALFAFARRLGGSNVYGSLGTVIAIIMVLAMEVGLSPVLDRFSADPMQDMRWTIFSTSMEGVGNHFPLGSGPGTYPQVYPPYQPQDVGAFINNAHNDYLEWLFEGGVIAAVLVLVFFYFYARQWKTLWIGEKWRTFRFIQVGAGIGVLLMLLHTFIDFNLHKPANAVFFAFFLAVFFKENREEVTMLRQKRKRRTEAKLREVE